MSSNREVVERAVQALATHDMETFRATLTDDATWWIAGDLPGVSGVKANPDEMVDFFGGTTQFFPRGLDLTISSIVEGDDAVAVEWRVRADAVTGRQYDNRYCVIFELRDGLIKAGREYLDTKHAYDRVLS